MPAYRSHKSDLGSDPRGFHDFVAETTHHAYRAASLAAFAPIVKPPIHFFRVTGQNKKPRIAPGLLEFG
ncbi:MAG: hypothetical protein EBU00_07135 [Alphaproteobacteria bacterium]|nr:hypothetical protein [Alphaproteobacteria bacterium]